MWGSDVRTVDVFGFETWDLYIVLIKYRYMKYWVAHLPRILYIRVLSKHGDSPAVTWAESDGSWKLQLLCLSAMQLSLETSQPNNWRIWCYMECQIDAKLSTIDRYVVIPTRVRPHFSYLSIFFILVWGVWCVSFEHWYWCYILFDRLTVVLYINILRI